MSSTTIGIKIANRTYVPILEKGVKDKKRLVLTTVKDNQENVQIDLYENEQESMDSARYIGSLLIENVPPTPAGEADVELVVALDEKGTLSANAHEAVTGESQSLSVSLESLGSEGIYDIPEFELGADLDSDLTDWDDSEAAEPAQTVGEYGFDDEFEPVGPDEQEAIVERRRPVMLGLFIALGVAAVVLIALLLFKLLEAPRVPALEAKNDGSQTTTQSAEPSATGGGPALPQETAQQQSSSGTAQTASGGAAPSQQPVVYPDTPQEGRLGGTWYWIRWGDTLWGLSTSFYRDPWLYREIARQNEIADPDRIYAGSRIYIPSR